MYYYLHQKHSSTILLSRFKGYLHVTRFVFYHILSTRHHLQVRISISLNTPWSTYYITGFVFAVFLGKLYSRVHRRLSFIKCNQKNMEAAFHEQEDCRLHGVAVETLRRRVNGPPTIFLYRKKISLKST